MSGPSENWNGPHHLQAIPLPIACAIAIALFPVFRISFTVVIVNEAPDPGISIVTGKPWERINFASEEQVQMCVHPSAIFSPFSAGQSSRSTYKVTPCSTGYQQSYPQKTYGYSHVINNLFFLERIVLYRIFQSATCVPKLSLPLFCNEMHFPFI